MCDWIDYVHERLKDLRLPSERKREIAAEIAGHLEEISQAHRLAGLSEEEAREVAVRQIGDWHKFCREVQSATEDFMTKWLRKIIVPGMLAFVIGGLFERFLYAIGVWPRMLRFRTFGWITINWIWLLAVVFCGGLAAYVSRRAGATTSQRIVAALFPVATIAGFILLSGALTIAFRAATGNVGIVPTVVLEGMGGYLTGFVVLPGMALMLGALPFLSGDAAPEQTSPALQDRA